MPCTMLAAMAQAVEFGLIDPNEPEAAGEHLHLAGGDSPTRDPAVDSRAGCVEPGREFPNGQFPWLAFLQTSRQG